MADSSTPPTAAQGSDAPTLRPGSAGVPAGTPSDETAALPGSPAGGTPAVRSAGVSPAGAGGTPALPGAGGTPALPGAAPVRKFGDYELLGELARGGMGVVYKARQVSLNRTVALKMILTGQLASTPEVQRFQAALDHPNIIPIYEVGEQEGQQFFSMKLIEGGSLSQRIPQFVHDPKSAARVLAAVARAVHFAHQRGILHRDLKPANVLLDQDLNPYVMDFGLAKRVEEDSGLTESGAVVGTASYMSPEQASGQAKFLTTAADTYGLGAILYEMLTAHPPFKAATALSTLMKVRNDEPVAPRKLNPRVDRDLEIICLKCLEKDPAKRYASAEALAEDLERWAKNEPIVARASSPWERLVKWVRRRPMAAALVAVSVLALLSLIGGGAWYNARLSVEKNKAVAEAERARAAEQQQGLEAERARRAEAEARMQQQEADKQRNHATLRLADSLLSQADALCLAGRPRESLDRYNEAKRTLTALGEPTFAVETGLFELNHAHPPPLHTFSGHREGVSCVAFSPDGKLALSGSIDKTLKLWDLSTGSELRTFSGHTDRVNSIAFSPDGKLALSGSWDKTVKLWDVATGRELRIFSGHNHTVYGVAFSPDGKLALSGSHDRTLKLWDVASGHELRTFSGNKGGVSSVAFSPDGKLALSGVDKALKLWDVATGRELRTFSGHKY
ncbi:MAG: protein kinase, partial [Planctomycetota bacterium]